MEKYPSYLAQDPRPLVFVTGTVENEPDIHDRVISCLDKTNTDIEQRDFPPLAFKVVLQDHRFLVKKSSRDTFVVDGILKFNTLQKHHEHLPSVVILLSAFSIDWQQNEWSGRENTIADYVANVRAMLNSRDVKIVIVLVKTGAGSMDKETMDERILGFRRRLALDGRTFAFVSPSEISPTNASMRRLSKTTRELSSMYYVALERRSRGQIRNAPQRAPFDGLLVGRYSFKLALFLEFQGLQSQAVKYYKQCFNALADTMFKTDEALIDQLKAVAEYSHFKICLLLLRVGALKDAIAQFKLHVSTFAHAYAGIIWRHDSWLSDQYRVFLQLIDAFQIPDADIQQEDLDRSFFLRNAARFEMRRHESFTCVISAVSRENYALRLQVLQNLVLLTPKYVGAIPTLVKPILEPQAESSSSVSSEEESQGWSKWYIEEVERSFDHDAVIMDLLNRAINLIPDTHTRRRAMAGAMIAEQYMRVGRLDLGINCIDTPIQLLCEEGWVAAAIPLLRKKLSCALELCRPKEYLDAALLLYSLGAKVHLDHYEKEQLHGNIMLLLRPNERAIASLNNEQHFLSPTSSATPLQRNLVVSFAEAAAEASHAGHTTNSDSNNITAAALAKSGASELPLSYTVDLGGLARMIDVSSSFSSPSVEVGRSVTVTLTLTSKFECDLSVDELYVRFTGGVLAQKIIHPVLGASVENANALPGQTSSVSEQQTSLSVRTGREPCCRRSGSGSGSKGGGGVCAAVTSNGAGNGPSTVSAAAICEACLTIPAAGTPWTISFDIMITEDAYNSLSPSDPSICLERIQLVLKNPAVLINVPDSPSTDESSSPNSDSDAAAAADGGGGGITQKLALAQRTVVLDVSAVSQQFDRCLRERQSVVAANTNNATTGLSTSTPPKPVPTLKDICAFIGAKRSPALLQVSRPRALIEIISPAVKSMNSLTTAPPAVSASPIQAQSDVQLLQGPLQRLDVVFKAGANHVLRGRVYLSSDFVPDDTPSALFWYPDVAAIAEADIANGGDTEVTSAFLDSIQFHPFQLSSSKQPSQPMLLGDLLPESTFSIPLFLRSEQQRICRIRLCIEFVPQKGLESTVMKDFDITVSFERPMQMNFGLSSMKEAQCGVLREGVPSTVLRGDLISITTSLTCLGLKSAGIRLLNMSFSHSSSDDEQQGEQAEVPPSQKKSSSTKSLFTLEGSVESVDLLQRTLSARRKTAELTNSPLLPLPQDVCVKLQRDEVFVACVDVACAEAAESDPSLDWSLADGGGFDSLAAAFGDTLYIGGAGTGAGAASGTGIEATVASIGDVYVEWRLDNDNLLLAPDLTTNKQLAFALAPSTSFSSSYPAASAKGFSGRISSKQSSIVSSRSPSSKLSLDWLPKLGPWSQTKIMEAVEPLSSSSSVERAKSSSAALDLRISTTRICGMMFSVPPVRVVNAPFDVEVVIPSVGKCDKQVRVEVIVKSKIWTPERVALSTIVPGRYTLSTSGSGSASNAYNSVVGGGEIPAVFDRRQHGFMVSGCSSAVFEVAPRGTRTISFSLIPLQCGHIPIPHIRVVWEKNNVPIVELGSASSPRQIFVLP